MSKNTKVSALLHSILIPLLDFLFVIIYNPFGVNDLLSIGRLSFISNLAIIMSIIFGCTALSRTLMLTVGAKVTEQNRFYAAWCLAEIVLSSLFTAMYITLMIGGRVSYFEVARTTSGIMFGISVFPYAFLFLSMDYYARYKASEEESSRDKASLIRFYDEYHKLKFIIASTAIVYIKSEDNYVQIYYMDQQKMKRQILRSSMRALESSLAKHGLVRCHRSFIINPEYIQVLHKDGNGALVAELNRDGVEGIPVSRKYQEEITKLL